MSCKHSDYHSLRHYACCATRFIAKLGNNLDILAPGFSDLLHNYLYSDGKLYELHVYWETSVGT